MFIFFFFLLDQERLRVFIVRFRLGCFQCSYCWCY